jgi:predicted RNA-binding protein YlxR (DUF448 family)
VLRGDEVVADPAGTAPGRGAYVCSAACLQDAIRRRAFARAYRKPVVVGDELPTRLGH